MTTPSHLRMTEGPRFDRQWWQHPSAWPQFFMASPGTEITRSKTRHHALILSAHEVSARSSMPQVDAWLAAGEEPGAAPRLLCLDSGIHNLAIACSRTLDLSFAEAVALPPESVPGFDRLRVHYETVITRARTQPLWGYFELDQGDVDARTRLRTELEGRGFAPIPIFRYGADPLDYFDELMRTYDRVGVGSIVDSDSAQAAGVTTEAQIIGSWWERWQRVNPRCWLHILGYTPKPLLLAYPFPSTDSSDWTSAMRWDGVRPRLDTQRFGQMPSGYRHARGHPNDGPRGTRRVATMSALNCLYDARTWTAHISGLRTLLDQ